MTNIFSCAETINGKNATIKKPTIVFIISFRLMMFMCCGFVCCSFMFIMIVCVLCCVFQSIMVMAENCLVSIFSMQPANKSFVKVNDINRKSNYVQCVLHVQLNLKFIENKDTDVCK